MEDLFSSYTAIILLIIASVMILIVGGWILALFIKRFKLGFNQTQPTPNNQSKANSGLVKVVFITLLLVLALYKIYNFIFSESYNGNWDTTQFGIWVQETLNLSSTEANIILWITFVLLLITVLSYILDLKALRGKIKINVSLGITLIFIIGVTVYGIVIKGEAVQKWMDDFSLFGERVDRTPKLRFQRIGQSENITMTINTELRVVLPSSRVNSGLVTEVCFELVGPPLLKEHRDLPKEILRNLNGTVSGPIHDFRISTEVVTLMSTNNINSIDVKGTIKEILPGTKCP